MLVRRDTQDGLLRGSIIEELVVAVGRNKVVAVVSRIGRDNNGRVKFIWRVIGADVDGGGIIQAARANFNRMDTR